MWLLDVAFVKCDAVKIEKKKIKLRLPLSLIGTLRVQVGLHCRMLAKSKPELGVGIHDGAFMQVKRSSRFY